MFELHIDGFVVKNKDYYVLRKMAEAHISPFEIFELKQSAMNDPNFQVCILPDEKIVDIKRHLKRGYSKKSVAAKYRVSEYTIIKAVRNLDIIEKNLRP